MDQALIDFANQNGFDPHSVQSLADFITERTAKYVTAENAASLIDGELVQAMVPEWMRVQEQLSVTAHVNPTAFARGLLDLIQAERAA